MQRFFELFGKNIRSIIAVSIVWLSFAFLFILIFRSIPSTNEPILNIAAGIILAKLGDVTAYLFGSSKDKSDKEKAEILQNSSAAITTTIEKDKNEPE